MMTDIRNLQAFALYIQKTDVKFDLFSVTKEMEKQVQNSHEFAICLVLLDISFSFLFHILIPLRYFLALMFAIC